MIESLRARFAIIAIVVIATIVWTVPNFVNLEKMWWPTKNKMVLGLDIQGGSHLVLRVDVDSAVKQDATRLSLQIPNDLNEKKAPIKGVKLTDPMRGAMQLELNKADDRALVEKAFEDMYGYTMRIGKFEGSTLSVEYSELYVREFKTRLLDQAIATIRNRIDEFGVAEPSITAQGSDRILVQLPGIKDAASAKDLINRTARLDFMIQSMEMDPQKVQELVGEAEKANNIKFGELRYTQYVDKINELLKGKIPANTIVYFEKPEAAASMETGRVAYLLSTTDTVMGDKLTNASVNMDQYGAPIVQFRFDSMGARQFADLTRKHVKKPMAIVLDKVVKSAPTITEPITQGSGQITLGRSRDQQASLNEAKVISTALRAGALPATLEQLEERTVGPSLGADAIRQGQIGTIIAGLAVFVFMAFYYKGFGVIADVALALNLLMTIAILSSMGATLTLPGVAGLALTLGISVDASVIIFERIKEELRKGISISAAIREGYDRAFSSILDANLTSIAVCIVLMYFGTGPVRGFAVTLLTGLVITTFTGVFFTRAILDLIVVKWKRNLTFTFN